METLLNTLKQDFPRLTFKAADDFYWSPQEQSVYYTNAKRQSDVWSLLHEASHGILNHQTFITDFELLQLELAAWKKAEELAIRYNMILDINHVEDCLDTYRDWLHKRSLCPSCGVKSLQENASTYRCLNCDTAWRVSANRHCRPYRARITSQI